MSSDSPYRALFATGQPLYVGIDLGTTNSAAAVFDGDKLTVVRNAQGGTLTPSVVRLDASGRVTVGTRALQKLDRDPDNTRSEFKRLMGTGKKLDFPASGKALRPEELASHILSSLRADIGDQLGAVPERAAISVPALFELPQNSATSEAARLAGFAQVELIQEPIASALAAGWQGDSGAAPWLVYDLGGGTFDVSLLETRDGLLRVVGHDGDNFLGGRDFDLALVEWAIAELGKRGVTLSRENPADAGAVRALKRAAEEAKIELSRRDEVVCALAEPLLVGGREVEVELPIDRKTLEAVCAPAVERSLAVCRRLLDQHGLTQKQLGRVVLVGGPTVMPLVRRRVEDGLGVPVAEGHDPMTLVAQGAALYAATAGLDGRAAGPPQSARGARIWQLWMQFPAVSADLTPHVVGKVVGAGEDARPVRVQLRRLGQTPWEGSAVEVDEEGAFFCTVDLLPRRPNQFAVRAFAADGSAVPVEPETLTIVQGLTIGDPPLSRTIGVALADDTVRVYFERGAPLPARRTFTHHTVETVARGAQQSPLKIPLVQGEFEQAHLCRLIGTLEIAGEELRDSLPMDSRIEVTLELDRGGRLTAKALVPAVGQAFDSVAHLLVPEADPETLAATLVSLRRRVDTLRAEAFRSGSTKTIERLGNAETALTGVDSDIAAARGGDSDAGQKALRSLLEVDASLADAEFDRKWPELEDKARDDLSFASEWVSRYGSPSEQSLLEEIGEAVARARENRNVGELQRQLRLARRLGTSAFYRHPEAWEWMFESAASEIAAATDLPRAHRLVAEGRAAIGRGDSGALRSVVEQLWRVLPADAESRRMSFDSGVR